MRYKLNEILLHYKENISIGALIFNDWVFKFILGPFSLIIMIIPTVLQVIFEFNQLIFSVALIISGFIALFVILNPYAKLKVKNLLKIKDKIGFFTLWAIDDFRKYQVKKLVEYFQSIKITEIAQYELLVETMENKIKSTRPYLIIKFGFLFSILIPVWLQINQWIVNKITDLKFLISWGLVITVLVILIWYLANQIAMIYNEILNIENQRIKRLSTLLKDILFDLKMKNYATKSSRQLRHQ